MMSSDILSFVNIHNCLPLLIWGSSGGSDSKEPACNAGVLGLIPGSEVPLEKKMANPLQYICLEIPIDREPGPRGLQRVGQD